MKLTFDSPSDATITRFPQGYWHVITDDGGWDAVGATPLDALADLVQQLEEQVRK